MRRLRQIAVGLVGCSVGFIAPLVVSSTPVQSVEVGRGEALSNLIGTSWMYGGLLSFVRPAPSDPATVRLRFPTEGKVEVVGPCGSDVGELQTVTRKEFSAAPWILVGKFATASAAECPGSPRQGTVGDLIRSGINGSESGLQAMFQSNGHTFFQDTETGLTPLVGTSWDVESVDGKMLAPLHWNVEFLSTGFIGGSDGCNGFYGFYVTNGDRLKTSGLTSTAIGCSFHSSLPLPFGPSSKTRFQISPNQLTVTEDGGPTYVLRPKGFGLPLTGTKWKTLVRGRKAALLFLPESRAQIATPCYRAEVPFTQQRLEGPGLRYTFSFDFGGVSLPDKRKCSVGSELLRDLQNVTMRSQDSLVMRLGDGQSPLPESFRSRLAFELDTPTDPEKLLIGTRWRLESLSPGAANEIEFRANGTLRFSKQCGSWIYRVASDNKLEIQQKDTCKVRFPPGPFDLPVLRFTLSDDRKSLDLFNIANRSIANYKKAR
jgi:META domain